MRLEASPHHHQMTEPSTTPTTCLTLPRYDHHDTEQHNMVDTAGVQGERGQECVSECEGWSV